MANKRKPAGRKVIHPKLPTNNPAPKYKTSGKAVKQDREGMRKFQTLMGGK